MVGEHARGRGPRTRRLRMPDGVDDMTVVGVPRGGRIVQPADDVGLGVSQLQPEEVREQRVVVEPRACRVEGDHEGVGPVERL